ncbi:MAG: cytochrome [Mycobacterium sp.]|jgi:ferredoxin|nr:cytochrome [Mycobacterium sp.]
MRVTVDHDLCQGHGLCTFAAPGLFDIDDSGHAVVLCEITDELELAATTAAESCPERAISLHDQSN